MAGGGPRAAILHTRPGKLRLPPGSALDILRAIINCRLLEMRSLTLAVLFALLGSFSAAADPGPIAITIKDHAFVPAEVKIPAGAKVELTIRNEQAVPAEFESASLHREKVVSPGSAISVYVGPLQRGRYEFFDDFHPATRGVVVVE
jgi:plastocyanin